MVYSGRFTETSWSPIALKLIAMILMTGIGLYNKVIKCDILRLVFNVRAPRTREKSR